MVWLVLPFSPCLQTSEQKIIFGTKKRKSSDLTDAECMTMTMSMEKMLRSYGRNLEKTF
ncbi:hypothetical protein MtrunA17_Chr4g0014021 [Medicago truncatula]|uniref:Uncharacterized protein n=1 Tax=Medicago truncatula TaxID=3880 RepID=A0A396I5J6_MEDTR|nr:hypothetical protein MtrunA17_Chr4g0014021 [Medicago truncatula]